MRTTIMTMRALAMAVSLVAGYGAVDVSAQNQPAPDLTGTWVLNAELSDKPSRPSANNASGERGRGRSGGPGGGLGGFGGGMGGRGGGMGGRGDGAMPSREEMDRERAVMDVAMRVPARLIIVKSETGLVLTDEDGISVRIPLDGKKETGAVNGVPFEATARWENGRLRLERKFKGGLKIVERYSLSPDSRQMTVTSKLEGGRMPGGARTVKRTYDRQELQGNVS